MLNNKLGSRRVNEISIDDINPMDGLSNLSDAMLVLAVGIMLALVVNWKIDIQSSKGSSTMTEVSQSEMQEIEFDMLKDSDTNAKDAQNSYEKSGTVYTDSKTGKTYVIMD
ncbi:MAG: DUF2149 domain-containing protein [Eubacteriales bacterium]|nr:DUF2149 domain-containing protein [Eubacteriales bacterium]